MRRGLSAVLGVIAIGGALVAAAPAAAKTTVKVNDNDVKITVTIDCVGCKEWTSPIDGSDLAKHWEKTAEKAWNEAFAKFPYCSKYKLTLDIKMRNRSADSGSRFGPHRLVATTPDGRGFTGAGWGGAPEGTPGGPQDQRAPDGTRYYEFDAEGTMPADATPTVIIHEFGHVLGLGDDRDAAGVALPGRGGTMMVGGATGVTPNTRLKIDKDLIDRIGDQLANLGEIDCGKTWRGSIDGSGDNIGICTNVSNHRGTFVLRDPPRGEPTLSGHIDNTAGTGCGAAGRPEHTQADFRSEGSRTETGFRFGPDGFLPFSVVMRERGDRVTGRGDFQAGIYKVIIKLEGEREADAVG